MVNNMKQKRQVLEFLKDNYGMINSLMCNEEKRIFHGDVSKILVKEVEKQILTDGSTKKPVNGVDWEMEIANLGDMYTAELARLTAEYEDKISQMQTLHEEEISNLKLEIQSTGRRIKECETANKIYEAQIQMLNLIFGRIRR